MSNSPVHIDRAFDIDLRRRVRNQLSSRAALRRIRVDVINGVVFLEGLVRSIHDRRLATHGCRRVAGVRAVDNRIAVDNREALHAQPRGTFDAVLDLETCST
jgi:osmotically-inducible protein OsmY